MKIKLKHILEGFAVGKLFVFNFSSCCLNIHGGIRRVFIHHLLLFNYSLLIHSLDVLNYINCHHYWRRGIFNFFSAFRFSRCRNFSTRWLVIWNCKNGKFHLGVPKLLSSFVTKRGTRNFVIESTRGIQVSAIKKDFEIFFLGTDKRFPSRVLFWRSPANGMTPFQFYDNANVLLGIRRRFKHNRRCRRWHRVATAPLKETNYTIKRNTKRRFSTRNFRGDTFFSCSNGNYTNHTFSFLRS